jgi:hypothetical protein
MRNEIPERNNKRGNGRKNEEMWLLARKEIILALSRQGGHKPV